MPRKLGHENAWCHSRNKTLVRALRSHPLPPSSPTGLCVSRSWLFSNNKNQTEQASLATQQEQSTGRQTQCILYSWGQVGDYYMIGVFKPINECSDTQWPFNIRKWIPKPRVLVKDTCSKSRIYPAASPHDILDMPGSRPPGFAHVTTAFLHQCLQTGEKT